MSATENPPAEGRVPLVGDAYAEIERFIFVEARLADESRYAEWEALVDDDMFYWVPRGEGDWDRDAHVSITADNRNRLANRLKQLRTGTRHSQVPPSPMRRIVSNVEAYREANGEYSAGCNFVLYELRVQSTGQLQVWPGRAEYRLRRKDGTLRMFLKKVMLVNGDTPLTSLSFIL
ncbi:MAG: aromatic-ring-hydroxylating dioxygenase subunit beta [Betaproteobacteria bacterium]|jgi:benzoate/toluate 1,2-dioxygenase beta subunit